MLYFASLVWFGTVILVNCIIIPHLVNVFSSFCIRVNFLLSSFYFCCSLHFPFIHFAFSCTSSSFPSPSTSLYQFLFPSSPSLLSVIHFTSLSCTLISPVLFSFSFSSLTPSMYQFLFASSPSLPSIIHFTFLSSTSLSPASLSPSPLQLSSLMTPNIHQGAHVNL